MTATTTPTLEAIYAFEAEHNGIGRLHGEIEGEILTILGIRPTRYFQLLLRYAASPEALALDPILTNRINARRAALRAARDHLGGPR